MTCEKSDGCSTWWNDVHGYLRAQTELRHRRLTEETLALAELAGRTLAVDLISQVNLPNFRRAMMDGVAVEGTPGPPGELRAVVLATTTAASVSSAPGVAYPISTGGAMPASCDSVIPMEHLCDEHGAPINRVRSGQNLRFVAQHGFRRGQHVAAIGEDVRIGQCLLPTGRVLRPQDLGLLSACGVTEAICQQRPRVCLGLTGDEIVPPGEPLRPAQIHDANGPVLRALVQRDGGTVSELRYLADDASAIRSFVQDERADVIILCGGTSVGPQDLVAAAVQQVGQLAFHGLPIRPGRPVGLGATQTASVFLLPGNPIACQFTYDLLVRPLLRRLGGYDSDWPYRSEIARVTEEVPSKLGRLDYLRVIRGESPGRNPSDSSQGAPDADERNAAPTRRWVQPLTSGRASNLTSVARADGFVLVTPDLARLTRSQEVTCYWYDPPQDMDLS